MQAPSKMDQVCLTRQHKVSLMQQADDIISDYYYDDEDEFEEIEEIEIQQPQPRNQTLEEQAKDYAMDDDIGSHYNIAVQRSGAPSLQQCHTFLPLSQESIRTEGHNDSTPEVEEQVTCAKNLVLKPQQSLQQRIFTRESANNTFKRGRENNLIGENDVGADQFQHEHEDATIEEEVIASQELVQDPVWIHTSLTLSQGSASKSSENDDIARLRAPARIEMTHDNLPLDQRIPSLTEASCAAGDSINTSSLRPNDYQQTRAEGQQCQSSLQSRKMRNLSSKGVRKGFKVRNQENNRSKESLTQYATFGVVPGKRNLKRASYKSVKCSKGGTEMNESNQSKAEARSSQKERDVSQQDQYSSHKVLMSGRHIAMHMESQHQSTLKEQSLAAAASGHMIPATSHAVGQSQTGRRAISKQRKLKGLAKVVHNKKSNNNYSSQQQRRDDSEYSTQLHIYSSTTKQGQPVASSLQQLFSGSAKRGSSIQHPAPMSQKQSKSKARMIRNILQTSNLNTDKKAARVTQTGEIGSALITSAMTAPQVFEGLSQTKLGVEKEEKAIDNVFQDLFAGLLEEVGGQQGTQIQPTAGLAVQKVELDLKRAQVKQGYAAARQNLRDIQQKFESHKRDEISRLENCQTSLNLSIDSLIKRAEVEVENFKNREHTRIWRNANKLSTSWVTSLLVEAEKSRLFALQKTQRSFSQVIFTACEFPQPQSVGSKSQRGEVLVTQSTQKIMRERFGEFQTQEVFKFFSKLSSPLQFLIDFRSKPFQLLKNSSAAQTEAITAELLATQKRQSFPQTVLDFAKSKFLSPSSNPDQATEAHPVCIISSTQKAAATRASSFEHVTSSLRLPTPFQALQGTEDLLEGQETYKQASLMNCAQRQADSLVSNCVLNVLQADCKRLGANRYVYVCLKEAQAMDIELPRHAQMLSRISSNKAMGRLYEGATPIARCLKQASQHGPAFAPTLQVKPIKGLCQLKVGFRGRSSGDSQRSKMFGVLAEIDLSILKQTREYVQFFLPTQSHHALLQAGAPQGIALYVLERNCKDSGCVEGTMIRKLEPFETLFLLQFHLRLTKPAKLLDFVINTAEVTNWKNLAAGGTTNTSGQHGSSYKTKSGAKGGEGRNSITVGSIHHENDVEDSKDLSDQSRLRSDLLAQDQLFGGSEGQMQYLTIDERSKDHGKLLRRYIVRVGRQANSTSALSIIEKVEEVQAMQSRQGGSGSCEDSMFCVWPNCLKMTDEKYTISTIQQLIAQLAFQQNQTVVAASQAATQQNNNAYQCSSQQPQMASNPMSRGSKRPDSAYRLKQNSSMANQGGGGANQAGVGQTSASAGLALADCTVTKKVNKLRIALELELAENLYLRFIKKGKAFKEKTQGSHHQSHAKARAAWMTPSMTLAAAYGTNQSKFADAGTIAPILTTITQTGGPLSGLTGSMLSLGPLFARLCPFHQRVERFLAHRFGVSLQPGGPLNSNAFLKGLRVYENWRSETKHSLISDLFTTKAAAGVSGAPVTLMSDSLQRIYAFACSQVSQLSGPDLVNLIQTLQQIPRSINYPDKFFAWIERFAHQMSPLMVKNVQFSDAVAHFQFQLAPLSANLKQVKLNEDFIAIEMRKWINNTTGLQQVMNSQQRAYLRNNFAQLMKILTVTDVIHRFTFFQQFINKMTSLGVVGQNGSGQDSAKSGQYHHKSNKSAGGALSAQGQQQQQLAKGILHQKANLLPYATKQSSQTAAGGAIRIIPPEGILFQSPAQASSFQPQVVVPLSVISPGDQTFPAQQFISKVGNRASAQKGSSASVGATTSGSVTLEKSSLVVAKSKTSVAAQSNIVEQRGYFVIGSGSTSGPHQQPAYVANAQHSQQKPTIGHSIASLQTTLLPNAVQAPATSLDKITAIYGSNYRKTSKELFGQNQQQAYGNTNGSCVTGQAPTPLSQQFIISSDGFLSQKRQQAAYLDNSSHPRPSPVLQQSTAVREGTFEGAQGPQINNQVPMMRDFFSAADLTTSAEQSRRQQAQLAAQTAPKTQNLFIEPGARPSVVAGVNQQVRYMQQSTEIFKSYNTNQLLLNQSSDHNNQGKPLLKSHIATNDSAALDHQQAPIVRPSTCQQIQNLYDSKNEHHKQGLSNSRCKQRSNRTQQHLAPSNQASSLLQQQKTMGSHASAEQVTVHTKSPKKRFLSKNGAVSQAIACSYSTQGAKNGKMLISETANINSQGFTSFLPVQQHFSQQRSRETQGCLEKPSFQSFEECKGNNTQNSNAVMPAGGGGFSADLTMYQTEQVYTSQSKNKLGQACFAQRQGSQSKKKSLLKQQNTTGVSNINNQQQHQSYPSGAKQSTSKVSRRQRANSAKKELLASFVGVNGKRGGQTAHELSLPPNSKQHWSMQPASFGQALAQEQYHMGQLMASSGAGTVKDSSHQMAGRFSLAPPQNNVGAILFGTSGPTSVAHHQQSVEPLMPVRYASNQAARSQMDWFLKKNKNSAANGNQNALTAFLGQTSETSKTLVNKSKLGSEQPVAGMIGPSGYLTDKHYTIAPRYDSSVGFNSAIPPRPNITANSFPVPVPATAGSQISNRDISLTLAASRTGTADPSANGRKKKKAAPSRVPASIADRRINYSSGIRIVNSVLTPSNAPRSAVTAKPSQQREEEEEEAPTAGASSSQQPVIVRNITSAGQPHSAKQSSNLIEVQRATMVFNSSGGNMHQSQDVNHDSNHNNGSKSVTQQLMNFQKQSQSNTSNNNHHQHATDSKAQQLQVTYANAMPRLASANAYLTKQSRKLRPANLANNKGLTASNLHRHTAGNRNTFNLPASQEHVLSTGRRDEQHYAGGQQVKKNTLFKVSGDDIKGASTSK